LAEEKEPKTLKYFVANHKAIAVVTLVGSLTKATSQSLEECLSEILKSDAKWVVLNFRDVEPQVERTVFPALARFQKLIREKCVALRVTSFHPELKKLLNDYGLIRTDELKNNLTDAIQTLPPEPKPKDSA
jgi:anti-anti-sigma regulatory factor